MKDKSIEEIINKLQLPKSTIMCLHDLAQIQGNNPIFIKLIDELQEYSINSKEHEIKAEAFDYIKDTFNKYDNDVDQLIEAFKKISQN